jgi:hypothetical protein
MLDHRGDDRIDQDCHGSRLPAVPAAPGKTLVQAGLSLWKIICTRYLRQIVDSVVRENLGVWQGTESGRQGNRRETPKYTGWPPKSSSSRTYKPRSWCEDGDMRGAPRYHRPRPRITASTSSTALTIGPISPGQRVVEPALRRQHVAEFLLAHRQVRAATPRCSDRPPPDAL